MNGNFYGTTLSGGTYDRGAVFEITPAGQWNLLYSFCSQANCADGLYPLVGLIQDTDGKLYGTTWFGGTEDEGTIFKITPGGQLTTLYSFCSQVHCGDGDAPQAGLIQALNGKLYGEASSGGKNVRSNGGGDGTVFEITPAGQFTTLYRFCSQANCADGSGSYGGLIQATDGNLYGTTSHGGIRGGGTAFSLDVGLGPFVKTLLTVGRVGQRVLILGNNLTDATSVTFNGIAASFTVVASSVIQTTVPSGATTGPVMVTTPGGSLTSNVNFHVKE